jgi:hypothetical protein
VAITAAFSSDPNKQMQWKAFLRRTEASVAALDDVVRSISRFVLPLFEARHGGAMVEVWPSGGPWTTTATAVEH